MISQSWPLVARTQGYKEWLVVGWEGDGVDTLTPVVVPLSLWGLAAAATVVVGPKGDRVTRYADPPARPRVLALELIEAWYPLPDPAVAQ
jgi:hypothetical protein